MQWTDFIQLINSQDANALVTVPIVDKAEDLLPSLVALANTNGGYIIIGFDLNNYHLRGMSQAVAWYIDGLKQVCEYPFDYKYDTVERSGQTVLLIHVPEGDRKPYLYKKEYYIRDNGHTISGVLDEAGLAAAKTEFKTETQPEPSTIPTTFQSTDGPLPSEAPSPLPTSFNLQRQETEERNEETSAIDNEVISATAEAPEPEASTEVIEDAVTESKTSGVDTSFTPPSKTPTHSREEREEYIQEKKEAYPDLNRRQKKALTYLKHKDSIRNKAYRKQYSVSHKTAHIELTDLVDRGILVSQGSGRSTCYVLNIPVVDTEELEQELESIKDLMGTLTV